MRKIICFLLLLFLPLTAHAGEGVFWTEDGYRVMILNDAGEQLLLSEAREERDGFSQNVGVSFLIFTGEDSEPKYSTYVGGNGLDKLEHAAPAPDGWIAAGSSSSDNLNSGWHPGNYDGKEAKTDGWIVRLDAEAEALWTRCYGGTDWDSFNAICPAEDSGWVACGLTYSSDGNVVGWHDSGDLFTQPDGWIVHIDPDGNILWQATLGGSGYDELLAIRQIPGGYIAVGTTDSSDGDLAGLPGESQDGWVVLLDEDGVLVHQARYGGRQKDAFSALSVEGSTGFLATGTSWSSGEADNTRIGWAVNLDAGGNALWEAYFGTDLGIEYPKFAIPSRNYWVLSGFTQIEEDSNSWIIGFLYNGNDWWLLEGRI